MSLACLLVQLTYMMIKNFNGEASRTFMVPDVSILTQNDQESENIVCRGNFHIIGGMFQS